MNTIAINDTRHNFTDFERITRGLRWFVIAAVIMTFPDDQARILIIYALALAAIAFNLSRYSATFFTMAHIRLSYNRTYYRQYIDRITHCISGRY